MLETYKLREQLHSLRQEQSHLLYQNDAACRVIARLQRERDEARAVLSQGSQKQGEKRREPQDAQEGRGNEEEAPSSKRMREEGGDHSSFKEEVDRALKELSSSRKAKKSQFVPIPAEDAQRMAPSQTHPLHKVNSGGILDLHAKGPTVATAGQDGQCIVFDSANGSIISSLKAHTKKATAVRLLDSSASALLSGGGGVDKTVCLWRAQAGDNGGHEKGASFSGHGGQIASVAFHPYGNFGASVGADGRWAVHDLKRGQSLHMSEPDESGFTWGGFHPDGGLLAAATEKGELKHFDVRTNSLALTLPCGDSPVSGCSFAENGYIAAAACEEGLKMLDLRKQGSSSVVATLDPIGKSPTAVAFDPQGLTLAAGSSFPCLISGKSPFDTLVSLPALGQRKSVRALSFGSDARTLFVAATDHILREYTVQAES